MSYFDEQGLRRSKRIRDMIINPPTAVEGTLDDAIYASGVPEVPPGGKRRGGARTVDAMKALVTRANEKGTELAKKLDALGEKIVENLPAAALATATGIAINHPTVFANLVSMIKNTTVASINASTVATWGQYTAAVAEISKAGVGLLSATAAASLKGPYVPLVAGLAMMRYRASNYANPDGTKGIPLTQLIEQDASNLFSASMRRITGEIQGFNEAWEKEAAQKAVDTIKAIGARAKPPTGPGVDATRLATRTGAPAVQRGIEPDAVEAVQGFVPQGTAASALRRIGSKSTRGQVERGPIPEQGRPGARPVEAPGPAVPAAEGAAGPAVPAAEGAAGPAANAMEGGRRYRKKTKKRAMKKRRMTRRKLTFSY